MANWMIYGAYGYSGALIVEEAVSRGHRPVVAGRNADKLRPVAEQFDLEMRAFPVADAANHLEGIELILHCAGPFIHTAEPMLRACIDTKTHYLDITGEWPVFERAFDLDTEAKSAGIVLMPGVGFDVVPSDCLAAYVASKLPDATELDIGLSMGTNASAGTLKSTIDALPNGNRARRDGELVKVPYRGATKSIRFSNGKSYQTLAIPWGDISTAYRSTGVPNITTYFVYPLAMVRYMATLGDTVPVMMRIKPLREFIKRQIEAIVQGPDAQARASTTGYIWAEARNDQGESAQAWLESAEGYEFTKLAAVRCVEQVLDRKLSGSLTPSQAFGADFVLQIPGSKRVDSLE